MSTEDVSLSLEEVDCHKRSNKIESARGNWGRSVFEWRANPQATRTRSRTCVAWRARNGHRILRALVRPFRHLVKPYSALALEVQVKRNVTFCAVNCDNERKTCEKHKVRAYPTIVAFNFASDAQQTAPPNGFSIKSGIKGVREYVNKKAS